ncbi:MAG TPA: hypothetical protein VFB78_07100 [Acidimicrobiales bacterium]|nr:hypothetical protein [Acidimicrobiales bacterium]
MKAGSRWRSAVCGTEVVVVKAPAGDVSLECGGHPMVPIDDDPPAGLVIDAGFAGGTPIGKRYTDEDSGLEVLASKGGDGTLAVNGTALPMKGAKPLPSSD